MVWIKRFISVLTVFLGMVGTLACVTAVAYTWIYSQRIDDSLEKVFSQIDLSLEELEFRAEESSLFVQETRNSAAALNDHVQAKLAAATGLSDAELDELERKLYATMQRANEWIGFAQSTTDLIEQLLEMANAIPGLMNQEPMGRQELVSTIRSGYREITVATEIAAQIRNDLQALRENPSLPERAKTLMTLFERVDVSLARVDQFANEFETGLSQLRTSIADQAQQFRRWIRVVGMAIRLFALWMGAGQRV